MINFLYNIIEKNSNLNELSSTLIIFGNIFMKVKSSFDIVINKLPLEVKILEILINRKFENAYEILNDIIWLFKIIVKKTNPESFTNVNKFFYFILF